MLRPDTQRLWDELQNDPLLGHFVLVGGTALSIHLNHRISEDLNFMIPDKKLPRNQINSLKRQCAAKGFTFVSNDSPMGLMEFEDTGLDYLDYQQDYVVGNTVKLTLIAPDPEVTFFLNSGTPKRPRIASVEEIFRLKCIACANRTKSRDWLDMYVLLKDEHFQPIDIYKTFEMAGIIQKFDIAMARMTRGSIDRGDEGYETVMKDPPSREQIQQYFCDVFAQIQSEVTKKKLSERPR
jgi:predicted nucleotidyltransferase component of viral defense system